MHKNIKILLICCTFFLFIQLSIANKEESMVLQNTIPLPNVEGRLDHLSLDPNTNRLFLTALGNNTLEVIDLDSKKRIQTVQGFSEPQGIAAVREFKKVYVTNGGSNEVNILDSETLKILGSIKLEEDVDNIRYDPIDKRIYVGSGEALFIIDTLSDKTIAQIRLKGHPEAFQLEKKGLRIFVNVPDVQKIQIIDRNKQKVVDEWPLTQGCSNFPMALDEINGRLFVGCRQIAKLLVLNSTTGQEIAQLNMGNDADDIFYDPISKNIYISAGEGAIDIYKQEDGDHYQFSNTIHTALGARTSLLDIDSHRFFLAVPHQSGQQAEIRIYH